MDLSKFIDLINKKQLFFSRADKFEDPFEGATTVKRIPERRKKMEEMFDNPGPKDIPIEIGGKEVIVGTIEHAEESDRIIKKFREIYFINCWHVNNTESEAMWKLYLKSNEGIAIQTTTDALKANIVDTSNSCIVDKVNYIDYENDVMDYKYNNMSIFFHKRNHFKHENELRVVTPFLHTKVLDEDKEKLVLDEEKQSETFGIHVPIKNISRLIKNVYVSPAAPDWFMEVVESILEKYDIKNEDGAILKPNKSILKNTPYY